MNNQKLVVFLVMPRCSSLKARGVSVVTQSGQAVGHLLGFIFDTSEGRILQLEIRPAGFVRGLVAHELVIAWEDVIVWSDKEIIVKDASFPVTPSVASAPSVAPGV